MQILLYPEGKQLLMRSLFWCVTSVFLLVGNQSALFMMPQSILVAIIIGYFLSLVVSYITLVYWPSLVPRRYISMLIDAASATLIMKYSGGITSPAFLLYVWLLTSNAMRFGMREVYTSQLLSILGFGFILYDDLDSLQHPIQILFQLVTLFVFPLYLHRLISVQSKARAQAELANTTKSRFLANMSHELRTPLNAIIGYSEMLREDALEYKHNQYTSDLDRILYSSKHLLNMINDVLDISKIEAGKMDVFYEQCNLQHLLDDISATIKPLLDKNANTLVMDRDSDLGTITTDGGKLRQTLYNLLSNATKFTEHGTIELHAARLTENNTEFVCFIVKDNGIGMSEEQLQRIFDPFEQADASSTRRYGGTGLGLPISKHFCEMLGGSITVSSSPGKGSTFRVQLPIAPPDKH